MRIHKALSFICLLTISAWSTPLPAAETRIAVAANFIDVARKLASAFEQEFEHKTRISYGSTGKLYAQIANGAPFDVFLAADVTRPARAEQERLAVRGSRFIYAKGKLVFWNAKSGVFSDGDEWLKRGEFRRLAIANPDTAPYGAAAKQILEKLGVWDKLGKKLVRGDSIAQTFQFVATGNAEAGFIALSQLNAWNGDHGTVWTPPKSLYHSINQAAVLLNNGADNPAAIAFMAFLKSKQAHAIIERFGYEV